MKSCFTWAALGAGVLVGCQQRKLEVADSPATPATGKLRFLEVNFGVTSVNFSHPKFLARAEEPR